MPKSRLASVLQAASSHGPLSPTREGGFGPMTSERAVLAGDAVVPLGSPARLCLQRAYRGRAGCPAHARRRERSGARAPTRGNTLAARQPRANRKANGSKRRGRDDAAPVRHRAHDAPPKDRTETCGPGCRRARAAAPDHLGAAPPAAGQAPAAHDHRARAPPPAAAQAPAAHP